jgi:hypothetical protein
MRDWMLWALVAYLGLWIMVLKLRVWNLVHQLKEASDAPERTIPF